MAFGVAKWSTFAVPRAGSVGSLHQRSPRPGEVGVAEHHQGLVRHVPARMSASRRAGSGGGTGPPMRDRLLPDDWAIRRNWSTIGCCRRPRPPPATSANSAVEPSWRNRLAPTPATTRRPKRSGCAAASTSSMRAPSENPMASTGRRAAAPRTHSSKASYAAGRSAGRAAVAGQVDEPTPHGRCPAAGPPNPVSHPRALGGRGEAVDQHDGGVAHGAASTAARRCGAASASTAERAQRGGLPRELGGRVRARPGHAARAARRRSSPTTQVGDQLVVGRGRAGRSTVDRRRRRGRRCGGHARRAARGRLGHRHAPALADRRRRHAHALRYRSTELVVGDAPGQADPVLGVELGDRRRACCRARSPRRRSRGAGRAPFACTSPAMRMRRGKSLTGTSRPTATSSAAWRASSAGRAAAGRCPDAPR